MQQTIKVPVHSVIDVITNSSTEIFTFASDNAKELCYEAINEILKVSGSDNKAEDLFDVTIVPNQDWLNDCLLDVIKDKEDETYEKFKDEIERVEAIEDWQERREPVQKLIEKIISYLNENNLMESYIEDEGWGSQSYVHITAKDSSVSTKNIYSLFGAAEYQEEGYC